MKRRDVLKTTAAVGAATLATSVFSLLQSCKAEPRLSWEPKFLTTDHAQMVSSMVDVILPKTDTPGGLDVNVDVFIDRFYAEIYDADAQKEAKEELSAFYDKCVTEMGQPFHELSAEDQVKFLQSEERSNAKFNSGVWGSAVGEQEPVGFYRRLKSTMIWAYGTSELVGQNHLIYDPIPGPYIGCLPLSEVGGTYSY